MLMVIFLILLYGLVLSYVGLMLMVVEGMMRPERRPWTSKRPAVSVIIPAHNEERKLGATLESLHRQTYPGPVEFVIVDDRSTDGTSEIIAGYAAIDPRFAPIRVDEPSSRLAPKVNAVNAGIRGSNGEIIVTSDADCVYPEGWLEGMVSHFADEVVMVVGYVECTRADRPRSRVAVFESIDWFSLMLTSRSLTRFGWKFASSANNQAYRRSAFEAIGGFGAGGRAPSGDEDLLTQRLGRLPGARIVFASAPEVRVLTHPMPTLAALLRQRKRWVSRYHHVMHFHPGFMASIAALGLQSVLLALAVPLSFAVPWIAPWVGVLWGLKLGVELSGMRLGTTQLGREDLWGVPALIWAVLHPFFIATVVVWSFLQPGEWRAGAASYRRRFWQRQLRETLRRARNLLAHGRSASGTGGNGW
jgi:cellulose synthase/poly-beta-1,6-N-acetylglucosamine synthase-like glycosyltransferase